MYGVNGILLDGNKSFYVGSRACVRVNGVLSDWFTTHVGLRQVCVMSPILFNVYMDGVMREVRGRLRQDMTLSMEGRRWKLPYLLYADDTLLFSESENGLQEAVEVFDSVCNNRLLKVNASKSKIVCLKGREILYVMWY